MGYVGGFEDKCNSDFPPKNSIFNIFDTKRSLMAVLRGLKGRLGVWQKRLTVDFYIYIGGSHEHRDTASRSPAKK